MLIQGETRTCRKRETEIGELIVCSLFTPISSAANRSYQPSQRGMPLKVRVRSTFRLPGGECSPSFWPPRIKSLRASLYPGSEAGVRPEQLWERRKMTSWKTTAATEQIDLRKPSETEPPIRKPAPPCGAAQASPVVSPPTGSPIRLNTMPYPASGPGGPLLTSRRH